MNQRNTVAFKNPFVQRPWLTTAVAAGAGENKELKAIAAGSLTGSLECVISYPTEYVKTQLQLEEKGTGKKFKGFADCVKYTVHKHGFFGLYRGMSALFYFGVPKSAGRFGAFEFLRGHMVEPNGQLSKSGKLLCGLGAGICESIVAVTPMQTIKTKLIDDQRSVNPRFRGFFHGVSTIIKTEGVAGVYKGLTATTLKQGSNQAMRFYVMESLKDWYKGDERDKPVPKLIIGAFGAIAGAASVFGNTPLDVIKTRMQSLDAAKYKNTLDCAVKIWKTEGVYGLYKGQVPRLYKVCLEVAVTFMLYDTFMELL